MNDYELEQRLREAAKTSFVPDVPGDLADRVRGKRIRRKRQRRALGAGAVVVSVLVMAIGWQIAGRTQLAGPAVRSGPGTQDMASSQSLDDDEIAALRAEVKQLRNDIARLDAQLQADAARERVEQQLVLLRRQQREPDPHDLALAESAKINFLLMQRAEMCERENRPDEARQEYEQVVSLFPNTAWAKTAQAKLDQNVSTEKQK